MVDQLVSASWLLEHINDDDLILLNASSSSLPENTITGARHFDIKNTFSNRRSTFPNTFPSATQFEKEAREIGICSHSHIVVYDDKGIFFSPRVWWMFTVMGHKKVSVLDGGLPVWKAHGFKLDPKIQTTYKKGDFRAVLQSSALKNYQDILQNKLSKDCYLLDARSKERFSGIAPEPRSHIKSGHIDGAINLPYTLVLNNGKYKSKEELKAIFAKLHIIDKPIIFSCGSGITACIILLAMDLISDNVKHLYDGSWTEWAERQELFT